jgi:hypothetical protein
LFCAAAADCTLSVGAAGVAQQLEDQLASLEAQDVAAAASQETAQALGDTAAQEQLASAQQTALDGYNNGVAQAYVAYQSSAYQDQSSVVTTLNSQLQIPWSQFEQQEADADQTWWSGDGSGQGQQAAYLNWFSQDQPAADAYPPRHLRTRPGQDGLQRRPRRQAGRVLLR